MGKFFISHSSLQSGTISWSRIRAGGILSRLLIEKTTETVAIFLNFGLPARTGASYVLVPVKRVGLFAGTKPLSDRHHVLRR